MSTSSMAPAPLVSLRAHAAHRWFLDQQTWIRVTTEQSGGSVAVVEHLIPAAAASPGTSTTSKTSPSMSWRPPHHARRR
jgi:hypothetical protein